MKSEVLQNLADLHKRLKALRRKVRAHESSQIARNALRKEAADLANLWVEDLRAPLEYRYALRQDTITEYSGQFERLLKLSRPSNLKSSYLSVLDHLLLKFQDRLVLPVQQYSEQIDTVLDLQKIVGGVGDKDEADYLREAVECAAHGNLRASVVIGWCAVVDRIQRKIEAVGFDRLNAASARLRAATSGRYKRFTKDVSVHSMAELRSGVFDSDLLWIAEGMALIDGNQRDRLATCFQLRNQSAHPGLAPVKEPNVVAFYSDVAEIVLRNPDFET